jgi:hypothetical protein
MSPMFSPRRRFARRIFAPAWRRGDRSCVGTRMRTGRRNVSTVGPKGHVPKGHIDRTGGDLEFSSRRPRSPPSPPSPPARPARPPCKRRAQSARRWDRHAGSMPRKREECPRRTGEGLVGVFGRRPDTMHRRGQRFRVKLRRAARVPDHGARRECDGAGREKEAGPEAVVVRMQRLRFGTPSMPVAFMKVRHGHAGPVDIGPRSNGARSPFPIASTYRLLLAMGGAPKPRRERALGTEVLSVSAAARRQSITRNSIAYGEIVWIPATRFARTPTNTMSGFTTCVPVFGKPRQSKLAA